MTPPRTTQHRTNSSDEDPPRKPKEGTELRRKQKKQGAKSNKAATARRISKANKTRKGNSKKKEKDKPDSSKNKPLRTPRKRAETNRKLEQAYRAEQAETFRVTVDVTAPPQSNVEVSVTVTLPSQELQYPPVLYVGLKKTLIGELLEDLTPDLPKVSPRHARLRKILHDRLMLLSEQFSPCIWQLNERLIHEKATLEENEWCAEYTFCIQGRYQKVLPILKVIVQYYLAPNYRISWRRLGHFEPKYESLVQLLDDTMRSVIAC